MNAVLDGALSAVDTLDDWLSETVNGFSAVMPVIADEDAATGAVPDGARGPR
ncbi:hypothetical protein ACLBX9_31040 [Methylobacterium sp. A49B]